MGTHQILESLKQLSTPERLIVIEAASRLIREEFDLRPGSHIAERTANMREAALAVRELYEQGGELTEWTSLDGEEVIDDDLGR